MAIKVLAGDWAPGTGCKFEPKLFGKPDRLRIGFFGPEFDASQVASIEIVTDQNKTSILAKAGWGLVGGIALGPLGMLAGLIGGGSKNEKIVALELADGRRALLQCDAKDYAHIMRLAFKPTVAATTPTPPLSPLNLETRARKQAEIEPTRMETQPSISQRSLEDLGVTIRKD
jgi:hypothetical protein